MATTKTINTYMGLEHEICLEKDELVYHITIQGLGVIAGSAVFKFAYEEEESHYRESDKDDFFSGQIYVPCGLLYTGMRVGSLLIHCIQKEHTCMQVTLSLAEKE